MKWRFDVAPSNARFFSNAQVRSFAGTFSIADDASQVISRERVVLFNVRDFVSIFAANVTVRGLLSMATPFRVSLCFDRTP